MMLLLRLMTIFGVHEGFVAEVCGADATVGCVIGGDGILAVTRLVRVAVYALSVSFSSCSQAFP